MNLRHSQVTECSLKRNPSGKKIHLLVSHKHKLPRQNIYERKFLTSSISFNIAIIRMSIELYGIRIAPVNNMHNYRSRERIKRFQQSCRIRNQVLLRWRGPAAQSIQWVTTSCNDRGWELWKYTLTLSYVSMPYHKANNKYIGPYDRWQALY
jgi:hypothetical protein